MTCTLDHTLKLRLFTQMLRIRTIEETVAERYTEGKMRCPVHLSIGQEAPAVGVCAALESRDYVMSTHRAHAHYLAKGGNLPRMLAEFYGKATGCTAGRGGSMHLIDLAANMLGSTPIVGSSFPVAVGVAFATWMNGEKNVMAVFFGEGSTEEGVFSEAINFAALKHLPIIFVCENNLYSVYSPMDVRQPKERDLIAIAKAHGMAGARGDGNDVEQVYQLTQEAVLRAREGLGPTFLELSTYRWREHCGANYDNNIGYRSEEEFTHWKARCPIQRYQAQLMRDNILSSEQLADIRQLHRTEIDAAFRFALESPFPSSDTVSHNLYA